MTTSRLHYALKQGYRHRHALAKFLDAGGSIANFVDLEARTLKTQGVAVLILDFDGVLAAHGETRPEPQAEAWMERAIGEFGAERTFVLSNRACPRRDQYLETRFPGLHSHFSARKKPFPDGIANIVEMTRTSAERVLVVDDRLLTGALAGCLSGVRIAYVRRPYRRFRERPFTEAWFTLLRYVERLLVRIMS